MRPPRTALSWWPRPPCSRGACRRETLDPGVQRKTRTEVRELTPAAGQIAMPLHDGSVRFAVIGDSGRGDDAQREVGLSPGTAAPDL